MTHIPDPDRRTWLTEQLATLIARQGWQHFVNAPIVEPNDRYFPDAWRPDADGLRVLALRLMRYAGLDTLDAEVELFWNDAQVTGFGAAGATSWARDGAAAWYAGTRNAVARYGVDASQLDDVEGIAGTLAHEVAHAYRDHHGLTVADHDLEEELTDLTTVFLGFGLLTTNASYRFRQAGLAGNSVDGTTWSTAAAGYLSTHDMAFLLALQVLACSRRAEHKTALRQLETTQRAFFKASAAHLQEDEPHLLERLALPTSDTFLHEPDSTTLEPLNLTLPEKAPAPPDPRDVGGFNAGRRIFRVCEPVDVYGPFFGSLVVGFPLHFAIAGLVGTGSTTTLALDLVAFGLGAALGWLVMRKWIQGERCSDWDCLARMPAKATECPHCHGVICGTVSSFEEAREAERAMRQQERKVARKERRKGRSKPSRKSRKQKR